MPADRSSPLMVSDITTSRGSTSSRERPSVPTTKSPLDALSATVSVKPIFQSAIRESTISSAGRATSTAARTASSVISSSSRSMSCARTKATSASTRGCTRVRMEIGVPSTPWLTSMSESR